MKTLPVIVGSAVKVTLASPLAVTAALAERMPAYGAGEVIAKVTVVPSVTGLFRAFKTCAVTFVFCPLVRFELSMLRVMDAGGLVIRKLADTLGIPATVAATVTVPDDVPA